MALKADAAAARGDLLVCIDGDALLDRDTAAYLVAPLIQYPHVGAVTGNPRIRTRSTLIGRIQVGEFSSIIGLIKRTQRIYGRVFTVSGVIAAFRRQALADVGYWSPDMITEDIDISWKLQLRHWDIFFEPRALCWILMPETLKGLWKQRLRWAQGGAEVFLVNLRKMARWEHHRMWPLFLEYALSTLWAFAYGATVVLFILSHIIPLPANPGRCEPVSPGVYRAAAGRNVPAAIPRQFVYRAALRAESGRLAVLGNLVPDGVLDDWPVYHPRGISESHA